MNILQKLINLITIGNMAGCYHENRVPVRGYHSKCADCGALTDERDFDHD